MKKGVIINQSQQAGTEFKNTYLISQCLYSMLKKTGYYDVRLVPCFRLNNTGSSDDTLLISSVNVANDYFYDLRKTFGKEDILQLDIHMDSFDGKAKGASAFFYPGSTAQNFANIIYEKLGGLLGKRSIESRGNLYTLKKSLARNVLVEFGFYDSQLNFVLDNLIDVCNLTHESIAKYFNI
jgi:hypothetical protein